MKKHDERWWKMMKHKQSDKIWMKRDEELVDNNSRLLEQFYHGSIAHGILRSEGVSVAALMSTCQLNTKLLFGSWSYSRTMVSNTNLWVALKVDWNILLNLWVSFECWTAGTDVWDSSGCHRPARWCAISSLERSSRCIWIQEMFAMMDLDGSKWIYIL